MASSGVEDSWISDRLRSSLLPIIIGLMGPTPDSDSDPDPDRVVLVNPTTQGMVVLRGDASAISEMLLSAGSGGEGVAPASKAAIEAMRSVDLSELDAEQECSVCLDELLKAREEEDEEKVKEMPCKHRFHGGCIEKWLKTNGSCPVCRFEMPKEEERGENKERPRREREVWVTISFRRREGEGDAGDGDDRQEQD